MRKKVKKPPDLLVKQRAASAWRRRGFEMQWAHHFADHTAFLEMHGGRFFGNARCQLAQADTLAVEVRNLGVARRDTRKSYSEVEDGIQRAVRATVAKYMGTEKIDLGELWNRINEDRGRGKPAPCRVHWSREELDKRMGVTEKERSFLNEKRRESEPLSCQLRILLRRQYIKACVANYQRRYGRRPKLQEIVDYLRERRGITVTGTCVGNDLRALRMKP